VLFSGILSNPSCYLSLLSSKFGLEKAKVTSSKGNLRNHIISYGEVKWLLLAGSLAPPAGQPGQYFPPVPLLNLSAYDMNMKRAILLLSLAGMGLLAACGATPPPETGPAVEEATSAPAEQTQPENSPEGNTPAATNAPTCYPEGDHPIAVSMAAQYSAITDYAEIMGWFCAGAEFEDILNALVTEELVGADPEALLVRIASGASWDQLWLELGITE
jgi:hypothetical protein